MRILAWICYISRRSPSAQNFRCCHHQSGMCDLAQGPVWIVDQHCDCSDLGATCVMPTPDHVSLPHTPSLSAAAGGRLHPGRADRPPAWGGPETPPGLCSTPVPDGHLLLCARVPGQQPAGDRQPLQAHTPAAVVQGPAGEQSEQLRATPSTAHTHTTDEAHQQDSQVTNAVHSTSNNAQEYITGHKFPRGPSVRSSWQRSLNCSTISLLATRRRALGSCC